MDIIPEALLWALYVPVEPSSGRRNTYASSHTWGKSWVQGAEMAVQW